MAPSSPPPPPPRGFTLFYIKFINVYLNAFLTIFGCPRWRHITLYYRYTRYLYNYIYVYNVIYAGIHNVYTLQQLSRNILVMSNTPSPRRKHCAVRIYVYMQYTHWAHKHTHGGCPFRFYLKRFRGFSYIIHRHTCIINVCMSADLYGFSKTLPETHNFVISHTRSYRRRAGFDMQYSL